MKLSGKTVYFVVNEGEIVDASFDREEMESRALDLNIDGTNDEIEESGRDVDDLTDDERGEFAFINGFNGGYHFVSYVKVPEDISEDDTFETDEGDEFTYNELIEAFDKDSFDDFDDFE